MDDIKAHIQPLLVRYAEEAHWVNPTVEYTTSMADEHDIYRSFDGQTGKMVGFSVAAVLLIAVVVGSCVEVTSIGNDPDYDREILKELGKFKNTA